MMPKQTPQLMLCNARANLSILARDGLRGVYHFEYATKIMRQAGKNLGAVKAAIKLTRTLSQVQ